MEGLTVQSPAPFVDCLDASGGQRFIRHAHLFMRFRSETVSFRAGERLLAVAYLWPLGEMARELALAILPAARSHMRPLCRHAHLTLARMADAGFTVTTHVAPGNRAGERMAHLVGFSQVPGSPGTWRIESEAGDQWAR